MKFLCGFFWIPAVYPWISESVCGKILPVSQAGNQRSLRWAGHGLRPSKTTRKRFTCVKKKGGTAMFRTFFNGVVNARLDELSLMERELKRSRSQERK